MADATLARAGTDRWRSGRRRGDRSTGRASVGGRPFDRFAAFVAILGAVAVIVANLVAAWLHPTTGLFADTISNLAAGRYHWILDAALVVFALGMVMVALAMWDMHLEGWRWRIGAALIGLSGFAIAVIALYNEYGDNDTGGLVIHLEVVVAMALAFAAGAILLSLGLTRIGSGWSAFSLWCGIGWLALGLAFFFLASDAWDGLVERLAAGLMVLWSLGMARLVGRERYPD